MATHRIQSVIFTLFFSTLVVMAGKPPRTTTPSASYTFVNASNPERTLAYDSGGNWVATFTVGARKVDLAGPVRTFSETTNRYSVHHSIWVRSLPTPYDGAPDTSWLNAALQSNYANVPDVLAIAMQYIADAPPVYDGTLQIGGDASYGPLQSDGTRAEGSDFNDYIGVAWYYPASNSTDNPEADQFRCLDCSGFMRMIWGYRHSFSGSGYEDSVPLALDPPGDHSALPRRSYQICSDGPGVLVIANTGVQVTDFSKLEVGDLVFFDASTDDGTQIDHVGMYLGVDSGKKYRFISSRKSIDGPTLGDYKGASVLNGAGLYATSFRAARRL